MADPDRDIRLKGDRQLEQTLIALAVLLGAVCLYQAFVKDSLVWGLGLVPAGLVFAGALASLKDRRPRLVISRQGVEDRAFGFGPLPWSAIVAIDETAVRQSRFLRLTLEDPGAWRARMPVGRRLAMDLRSFFGVPPFSIDPQAFKIDPDALFAVIVRRWQTAVSSDPAARPADPGDPGPRTARH